MHTSNIVSSLNPLTDVAGSGRYETLLKVFQPTIAHIDSSVMDDAFKEELMSDRVPRHENGRVVRHGWDKLAKAINTVLGMYEAGMVVTAVQVRNRYEHVKRASVWAFVDEENLKDGVTVKELALRFGVCERTMQDCFT
eukprot:m.68287 g.68287  ORF g.68287 m.68287 type:complete len:139 (+) comp14098_c0_seq19:404-820(+)